MDINLTGYDPLMNFITGFAIDESKKEIYVFGVSYRDDGNFTHIKKKRLIRVKHSKYKTLLRIIGEEYERERFKLLLKPIKGQNRNTYIIKLNLNNFEMISFLFALNKQTQNNIMNRMKFNYYFVSYGEFIRIFGKIILEELEHYDDSLSKNIKDSVRDLINKQRKLISRYVDKKFILEFYGNHIGEEQYSKRSEDGSALFNMLTYGRKTKELLPKPNSKFGVDADEHGSKMGWHFHYKIKKKGKKNLKRSIYLITFEPEESLNTALEPPLYWEEHGKKYIKIGLPNKSKRDKVYSICNNFRKTVRQEDFRDIKQIAYKELDRLNLFAVGTRND